MITHLQRKRQMTSHSSFSRCIAVSDMALCRAHSFARANDVATSCLPCRDVPCLLWQWTVVLHGGLWRGVEGKLITCDVCLKGYIHICTSPCQKYGNTLK